MTVKTIKVKLKDRPPEVDDCQIAGFIFDALSSWGGGLDPDNPFFDSLDIDHIQINNTKYIDRSDHDG